MNDCRVVATGVGIIAPNGIGSDQYWHALLSERSGLSVAGSEDCAYPTTTEAGNVHAFDVTHSVPSRLRSQTDRSTQFALTAAADALQDASVVTSELDEYGMSVVTSTSLGGLAFTHNELRKLKAEGPNRVSAYASFAWFYAVNTGQISIRNGMRGPSRALVTGQAGGLDAIGEGRRIIRKGTGFALAGGIDSAVDSLGWAVYDSAGDLSSSGYRPFEQDAGGFVPGEGGAFFALEEVVSARKRGARIYGEIAGYAATFDPGPGSARPPSLKRAIALALEDAKISPGDVGVVFADAAGTKESDDAEKDVLRELFGNRGVPVAVPKLLTGRLFAGAGALDVAVALLCVYHQCVPGVSSLREYDSDIDFVNRTRHLNLHNALVISRGRWGFNSAVVVQRVGTT